MSERGHADWDERHRGKAGRRQPSRSWPRCSRESRAASRSTLPQDAGATRSRSRERACRCVAVDYSAEAMRILAATARAARLAIWPVVANLDNFHLKDESFDAIVNINFLDRALFPKFVRALRPGGILIADTFLVDQAAIGHPRDPRFLLAHGELRALAGGLEVEEYREGVTDSANGERAFRASMVARRRKSN